MIGRVLKKINLFVILAGVFFWLSLYYGLLGGKLNTTLWMIFALAGFGCIYKSFPIFWKYSVFLLTIYIFGSVGASFIVAGLVTLTPLYVLLGLLCNLIAFFVIYNFCWKVIELGKIYKSYCSVGIWSIALLVFLGLTNLSLSDWAYWVIGKSNLTSYVIAECMLVPIAIYILWHLETKLKFVNLCVSCGSPLRWVILKCNSCGEEKKLAWCLKGEHWLLSCRFCKALTIFGKEKCSSCKKVIGKLLVCDSCNKASPLSEWQRI
jgi:hypothetical protein